MKLSNKILIGLLVAAFLYLTAVFAEIRFRGTPMIMDETNSVAERFPIEGVAHVVLDNIDGNIAIDVSDTARLEVRTTSGGVLSLMNYRFSDDTLKVSGLRNMDMRSRRIYIFIPRGSLKTLTVNRASASLANVAADSLYISQSGGSAYLSKNEIRNIKVKISGKSFLRISDSSLTRLHAEVDSSEMEVSSPLRSLSGRMKNGSSIYVNEVADIRFSKDENCRLYIDQWR